MRMFVSDSKPAISDQATPNLFLRLEHHGSTFHRAIHSFLPRTACRDRLRRRPLEGDEQARRASASATCRAASRDQAALACPRSGRAQGPSTLLRWRSLHPARGGRQPAPRLLPHLLASPALRWRPQPCLSTASRLLRSSLTHRVAGRPRIRETQRKDIDWDPESWRA